MFDDFKIWFRIHRSRGYPPIIQLTPKQWGRYLELIKPTYRESEYIRRTRWWAKLRLVEINKARPKVLPFPAAKQFTESAKR